MSHDNDTAQKAMQSNFKIVIAILAAILVF